VEVSRVLVDTSAYSAFMQGEPAIKATLQQAEQIYLNAVVLGELLAGFSGGTRPDKNRKEIKAFLSSPRVEVLELGDATAERYAVIFAFLRQQGAPIPTNDIWIAASAMEHGLCVLTRDPHFKKVPQVIVKCIEMQ
jgi:predicted nucleic acid-binding protein